MKIVILSGKVKGVLSELTTGEAIGSLPLVNKRLLNFTLEVLQEQLQVCCFQVLSCGRSKEFINRISEHLDWECSLLEFKGDSEYDSEEVLWLRDDVLYDMDFCQLINEARLAERQSTVFVSNNTPVIFYQKNNGWNKLPVSFSDTNTTNDLCHDLLTTHSWDREDIRFGTCYMVDSIKNYYHYSMNLLKGNFKTIILDFHQKGLSLVKGKHVDIDISSQQQSYAYLGDSVYVHPYSQLHEQVIFCANNYVDSFVDISDSIVLPGVYIGCYLNIKNAVVTSSSVIQVDTGNVLPIEDKTMIAEIVIAAG